MKQNFRNSFTKRGINKLLTGVLFTLLIFIFNNLKVSAQNSYSDNLNVKVPCSTYCDWSYSCQGTQGTLPTTLPITLDVFNFYFLTPANPATATYPFIITVAGTTTYKNCFFYVNKDVAVRITAGTTVTFDHCYFYNCSDMWTGIQVEYGGNIVLQNNCLIEDAKTAVDFLSPTSSGNNVPSITMSSTYSSSINEVITSTIFNKNSTDIRITNYNCLQDLPFSIYDNVFTCRYISRCINTWPSVATFKSFAHADDCTQEYIDDNSYPSTSISSTINPQCFLNSPACTKSSTAIELNNVGNSCINYSNCSAFAARHYYYLIVGDVNGHDGNENVFDNHYFGILTPPPYNPGNGSPDILSTTHANVKSYLNVFQNILHQPNSTTYTNTLSGTGICLIDISDGSGSLIANSQTAPNRFFDCQTAIRTYVHTDDDIEYCSVRSNKVFASPIDLPSLCFITPGAAIKYYENTGFYFNTGEYLNFNINHNTFTNINEGIQFDVRAVPGGIHWLDPCTGTTWSQGIFYTGILNINANTFDLLNCLGNEYIDNAISVNRTGLLGPYIGTCLNNKMIQINDNVINHAFRGIYTQGVIGEDIDIERNTINLESPDFINSITTYNGYNTQLKLNISTSNQYGVYMANCQPSTLCGTCVRKNYIRSNVISFPYDATFTHNSNFALSNHEYGIYVNKSPRNVVCDNITNDMQRGIEFNAACTPSVFTHNVFNISSSNSHPDYGMVLDNGGIIGPQGSSGGMFTYPTGNQWTSSYWGVGTNPYRTFTDNGSFAAASPMWEHSTTNESSNTSYLTTWPTLYVGYEYYTGCIPHSLYLVSPSMPSLACAAHPVYFYPHNIGGTTAADLRSRAVTEVIATPDTFDYYTDYNSFENIVAGTAAAYTAHPTEMDWLLKKGLYEQLRSDADSLLTDSLPAITAFYDSALVGNMHLIDSLSSLVFSFPDSAAGLLATFSPTNLPEQNYYNFFSWVLTLNDTTPVLSYSDSVALCALALGCPYYDGDAVYDARMLARVLYGWSSSIPDNCDNSSSEERKTNYNPNLPLLLNHSIQIIPNPNSGGFILLTEDGIYNIMINDITGKIGYQSTIEVKQGNYRISTDLSNGIYIFTITNCANGNKQFKKLVIQHDK